MPLDCECAGGGGGGRRTRRCGREGANKNAAQRFGERLKERKVKKLRASCEGANQRSSEHPGRGRNFAKVELEKKQEPDQTRKEHMTKQEKRMTRDID